jgi:hypothetical protein
MQNASKNFLPVAVVCGAALSLAACGETVGERTISGAGIGAGVGALGTAIAGANPITGAIIGAAVGGVGGAVTSPRAIDLGHPWWHYGD